MYAFNLRYPPLYTHKQYILKQAAYLICKINHGGADFFLMWYGFVSLLCSHVILFQQPHQTYLAK
jgi:hypothetical protein